MSRDDPVAAFAELGRSRRRMFWLDGGGSREWSGRRSLLGWLEDDDVSLTYDAARRLVHRHTGSGAQIVGEDIFGCLDEELARDRDDPSVHWVGYFGYASRADLPARPATRIPDAVWMRCRDPLVFEHEPEADVADSAAGPPSRAPSSLGAQAHPRLGDGALPAHAPVPDDYRAGFDEVQRQLRRGNSYEVNLTYRESVVSPDDPVATYLRLRQLSPAPYAGYLRHGDAHLLSASPERFATVDRRRWVETKPIKGTTARGATPVEDAEQRELLRSDPRFRAENLMIVDLLRNDISTVAAPGTVSVPVLMEVESYASVHQLVSTVRGRLREGVGTVEAIRALFPAGSMTGAPKLRTMGIIDSVESTPRGAYAGAFGWISGDGRADLGVVIRSLVAVPEGDGWRYEMGTGGGITVRSEVDGEYVESRWKIGRLQAALTAG